MGKQYPIYSVTRRCKVVYLLDYGKVFDPAVGRVRRRQRQFSKRKDAEAERQLLLDKSNPVNPSQMLLSADERQDARMALDMLRGSSSLSKAASFWLRHSNSSSSDIIIDDAVALWVQSKIDSNRRPDTIREAKTRGGVLVAGFQGQVVSNINTADIIQHLDSVSAGSRRNYQRLFSGFWSFAVKQGWAGSNIVESIPIPAKDDVDPAIFSLPDVIRLLRCCEDQYPELVPYFAIGIFAGLRPENELSLLDWSNINLNKRVIRVVGATAKKRRKRLVDISDNLYEWLLPHEKQSGCIYSSRRISRRVRDVSGVDWGHDIMRHSFGSYHLAAHSDLARTARLMGHSSPDVILNHYYALVEDRDARLFWEVVPREVKQLRTKKRRDGVVEFDRRATA